MILPSGIQRILKPFVFSSAPGHFLLSQSLFVGGLAWPLNSTLRLSKYTEQVTKAQPAASPVIVSVTKGMAEELLRERIWVSGKSEFKEEEFYRELCLIIAGSAG